MSTKWKVALSAVALLTSFAAGRWLAPEKIKVETKIVTVKEKVKVKDSDKNVHKETTITETAYPDGRKETKTVIVEDSNKKSNTKENENSTDTKEEVKTVERGTSKVTVSALAGLPLSLDSVIPVYGASITKPILGPIAVGAWGLSNKTFGMSLGLTF